MLTLMVQSLSVMFIRTLYLPQRIKIRNEYTEHSDQREDGDENLVACSAGNSLGSEYFESPV